MAFLPLWHEDSEAPYAYAVGFGIGKPGTAGVLDVTLGALTLSAGITGQIPGQMSLTATLGTLGLSAFGGPLILMQQAVYALVNAGLDVNIVRKRFDGIPYDYVIEWDPPVGTDVPEYSLVTLTVSDGPVNPLPGTSAIPNVVGKMAMDAMSSLASAGFSVDEFQWSADNSTGGTVLSQSPAAGTHAVPGTIVVLTLSIGPGTSTPDVVTP